MSLLKALKCLPLIALLALSLSGCAGSKGSSEGGGSGSDGGSYSDGGSSDGGGSNGEGGAPAAPKEEIDEDKLKKTQEDAMAVEKENHELRRQVFEAKNKLGIPVEQPAEE
jgi:hypothetical protein